MPDLTPAKSALIADTIKASVYHAGVLCFHGLSWDGESRWLRVDSESGWCISAQVDSLYSRLRRELFNSVTVGQSVRNKSPGAILKAMLQHGPIAFTPCSVERHVGFQIPHDVFIEANNPAGESPSNFATRQFFGAATSAMGIQTIDVVPRAWL